MTTLILIFFTSLTGGFQEPAVGTEMDAAVVETRNCAASATEREREAVTDSVLTNAIQVAPKIVSDILYVSLAYSFGEEVSLELYDVLGIRVRAQLMTGPRASIDVSKLTRGVYFLYAHLGNQQRVVKRVIIQ